jgi:hypothetical protein
MRGRGTGTGAGTGINRKQFLAGLGMVGVTGAAGPFLAACQSGEDEPDNSDADDSDADEPRGLRHRGVMYQVTEGEWPQTGWDARRMREDLRVIADELHASSVVVYGDGVERLAATATEAAERGLHVWLQPRLADLPQREILYHLAETGRHAEELRRQGAGVHLSVGCEFVLFTPGIVPGGDVLERIDNLMNGNVDPARMSRRLADFIERSAQTGRSVFDGELTYGAAEGDEVDWDLFDIVSVNYYAHHGRRRAAYADDLRPYRRWGKPVAITECGSCTYEGAPESGGMGWDVVDYTTQPPEIADGLVRSEPTQADYLTDVLGVFETLNLYAALVYEFATPDAPHRPDDPRHDEDMAAYSLVKTVWETPDQPGDWHWEPKQAFHAVANHFGRAARRA